MPKTWRFWGWVGALAITAGCGSGGGAAASDAGGSDATLAADAGNGDPAPGKATMNATFSNPVNGYNGQITPYAGLEADGTAEGIASSLKFISYTPNGTTARRNLYIYLRNMAPVPGMTYTVPFDVFGGNAIGYQELGPTWQCPGQLTFDSISGKVYRFHFTGTCTNLSGGAIGGVTVTGTGAGTLP